ncbi:MAG: hypothetical protein ACM3JJ_06615 [Hyphomicrobiales bacterium]
MSEWKIRLEPSAVPSGRVVLEVVNSGKVPHALEIEGRGVEKRTSQIAPGASATLALDLAAGTYEAYCPVGKGSHKKMGMESRLTVGGGGPGAAAASATMHDDRGRSEMTSDDDDDGEYGEPQVMKVLGGGPVIQILPGPYPFADSAMAVIRTRPAKEMADLAKKAHMGPYSNRVAKISGRISVRAIDHGAAGDSVSGVAEFTTQEGARWKLVLDRVQTRDVPFNPRFGGVIMGLYYHGATNVHTPLVPTIQSSVALWAVAHLYENDRLVTDDAMVHVMLLSRTRRPSDWALDCWDCSSRPVEELQLQVMPPPGGKPLDSPGGFLFVNWEASSGRLAAL